MDRGIKNAQTPRAAFQLPREAERGFSFEGRCMFTYTDEFGPPGCNGPRRALRAARTGENEWSGQQAHPAYPAAVSGWALRSCGEQGVQGPERSRGPWAKPLLYPCGGFPREQWLPDTLSIHISPREGESWKSFNSSLASNPVDTRTDGETSPQRGGHLSPVWGF